VKAGWEQFEVGKNGTPNNIEIGNAMDAAIGIDHTVGGGYAHPRGHRYGDTIRPILREMRPLPG